MPKYFKLKSISTVATTVLTVATLALTSCATSSLLEESPTRSKTQTKELFQDTLIAFGKPALPLPNMPANSIVIVGEEYSYVMSEGGTQLVNLLTTLDRRYFNLERALTFTSNNNDGKFSGKINLSYVKLKADFTDQDLRFFLQNGGTDCTNEKDSRINAQRFCFDINVRGGTYPKVSNYQAVTSNYNALSKPYTVSMQTKTTNPQLSADTNVAQKIVLLPFALAFDVITLPLQILQ